MNIIVVTSFMDEIEKISGGGTMIDGAIVRRRPSAVKARVGAIKGGFKGGLLGLGIGALTALGSAGKKALIVGPALGAALGAGIGGTSGWVRGKATEIMTGYDENDPRTK